MRGDLAKKLWQITVRARKIPQLHEIKEMVELDKKALNKLDPDSLLKYLRKYIICLCLKSAAHGINFIEISYTGSNVLDRLFDARAKAGQVYATVSLFGEKVLKKTRLKYLITHSPCLCEIRIEWNKKEEGK